MDLVDEHDGARIGLDLLDDGLDALLEIAPVAGAGQQHAHVELENGAVGQDLRHLTVDDAFGQSLGDGRLADSRIAHQQRIVLLAAAQHLDGAPHFHFAPDERVDLAVAGLLVEVDAVGVQRLGLRRGGVLLFLLLQILLVVLLLESGHARQARDVEFLVHPGRWLGT